MSIKIDIKSVGYGKGSVLRDVCALLPDGSFTAVIGRNGSGKSTLISALVGLIGFDGSVLYDTAELSNMSAGERALTVSAILQRQSAPHITVEELVTLGRSPHRRPFSHGKEIVERSIERASLSELRSAYLDKISGGELKRAYFAMLLAQQTKHVLLDEATASMDADYENEFLSLSAELAHSDGKCVMAVMHNIDAALRYADNLLLLSDGGVKFFGTRDEILATDIIERSFSLNRAEAAGRVFFYSK